MAGCFECGNELYILRLAEELVAAPKGLFTVELVNLMTFNERNYILQAVTICRGFFVVFLSLSFTALQSGLESLAPWTDISDAEPSDYKQDRQCMYNVTMRRVRITIVAVEKQ